MKYLLSLLFLATIATASFAQSDAPSPAASPSTSPIKHHRHPKAAATPTTVASPSPAASPTMPAAGSTGPTKNTHAAFVPSATAAPGGGNGLVWVNTSSKAYHKEGSKWYGRTKHGQFMSEQDAIKEGDHAAKN